jgi:hypothetical protein
LEVLYVDISSRGPSLDANFFLKEVLKRYCSPTLVLVSRGTWYDWSMEWQNVQMGVNREGIDPSSKSGLVCSKSNQTILSPIPHSGSTHSQIMDQTIRYLTQCEL